MSHTSLNYYYFWAVSGDRGQCSTAGHIVTVAIDQDTSESGRDGDAVGVRGGVVIEAAVVAVEAGAVVAVMATAAVTAMAAVAPAIYYDQDDERVCPDDDND